MGVPDDKLLELDAALGDLGVDEADVSAVLRRHEAEASPDLASVDAELEALAENIDIPKIESQVTVDLSAIETTAPEASVVVGDDWDSDKTEVEIIDEADDFVLLVDEGDLEELESAAEEVPNVTVPPPLPSKAEDADGDSEVDDDEDEGFFKKLFGSRRSSNRP